jgi:hypothetical protein
MLKINQTRRAAVYLRLETGSAGLEHPAKDGGNEDVSCSSEGVDRDGECLEGLKVNEGRKSDTTDGVDHDAN